MLQQGMLLAPYTGSLDLLHLSTAARWLKPYRFHLGSICLPLPRDLSGNKHKFLKMATSLLGMQQRLSRLRIEAGRFVVPALTAIKNGVSQGKTLQSLAIAALATPLSPNECEGLSAALISGACPALTVFQMSGKNLRNQELRCLAAAIRAGALPQLREIILAASEGAGYPHDNRAGITEVLETLEAGGCPMITKLSITGCYPGQSGFATFERAVRGGSFSGLKALKLESCGGGLGVAAGLMEALAEGGCPSIQALDLSRTSVREENVLPLLTAVGERRLPHFKNLNHNVGQLGHAGMVALSEAMCQGQEIEELSITNRSSGYLGPDLLTEQDYLLLVRQYGGSATRAMLKPSLECVQVERLRGGGGRQMKVLRVEGVKALTDQACVALMDALSDGACPHLTVLDLYFTRLGPLGAQRLAHAIETRALPRLGELDVSRSGIGLDGARALAAALRTGGAPELHKADLSCGFWGDTPKALRAEIVEGCPRLRKGGLRAGTWRDD
jgi:hypothetical protein